MPSAAASGCELEAGARPLKTVRFAWRAFGLWQLRAPLDFSRNLEAPGDVYSWGDQGAAQYIIQPIALPPRERSRSMADVSTPEEDALFTPRGHVSPVTAIPLALQHVLAAFAAIVTPAIIVASVCGFSAAEEARIIQAALVLSAVDTLLQQFPLFGRIGSGLPIVMGASFTFVPAFQAIGVEMGFEAVLGAQLVGGLLVVVFGLAFRRLRFLFPPVVMGTVIFVIGLSLCPVAVKSMAGGQGSAGFGDLSNWIVAIATFVVTFAVGNYARGTLKLGGILLGIISGFVIAALMGMVDLSGVGTAAWFALPTILPYKIVFDPAACAMIGVVSIVNVVQVMGELSAVSSAGLDREATDAELSGGMVATGAVGAVAALFGTIPTVTYGQNVGIIAENKVVNRVVFTIAALVLLAGGLLPKFAALLTSIPQPVIGGATIGVFATIGMNGVVMFAREGLSGRDCTLMGLAVAFGVGIEQSVGALAGAGFPAWVNTVFGTSSLAVATVVAVILNLVLPREEKASE